MRKIISHNYQVSSEERPWFYFAPIKFQNISKEPSNSRTLTFFSSPQTNFSVNKVTIQNIMFCDPDALHKVNTWWHNGVEKKLFVKPRVLRLENVGFVDMLRSLERICHYFDIKGDVKLALTRKKKL